MTLVTPPVGGMLRVVSMKTTGMPVKSGEVVMEFDPADQEYALEQAKSELAEAEQEIVKMKADAEVQKAQDDVALLTAKFDVRRAELDVMGNEFIAAVTAQKNVLSLEEAQRRLAQLNEDVKSRAATNQASLAVVQEKRTKAQLAMQRAQQVIVSCGGACGNRRLQQRAQQCRVGRLRLEREREPTATERCWPQPDHAADQQHADTKGQPQPHRARIGDTGAR